MRRHRRDKVSAGWDSSDRRWLGFPKSDPNPMIAEELAALEAIELADLRGQSRHRAIQELYESEMAR